LVARFGSLSLQALDGRTTQAPPFKPVRRLCGKTVTLKAWVISPGTERRGSTVIRDDHGWGSKVSVADSERTRYEVTFEVGPAARTMRVILDASSDTGQSGEGLFFDDLALVEEGAEAHEGLGDGSAETPVLRLECHRGGASRYVSSRQLFDPCSYDLAP
jgi:hypothetical protein